MFVYTTTIQNSLNYQYGNYDCTMTFKFLLGGSGQDGFSFDMNISTKPWNHEDYLLSDSAYLDSAQR